MLVAPKLKKDLEAPEGYDELVKKVKKEQIDF